MPFDYEEYQKKCDGLTTEQLHREWENYTRQIAGGATSTATSVLFSPFTAGISLVGLGLSAPRIHNARKKREIIQAGLEARGATHSTRKRDVIAPMAVAGTLSSLTLGLAGPGADMIAGEVVGHGAEYAASHVAFDATGAIVEHTHDKHAHKKAHQKLQVQYQNFQNEQEKQGVSKPQLSGNRSGLQIPQPASLVPPSSLVSQQGGLTAYQNQPQSLTQDQKYENVPMSTPHHASVSYQPASHQQTFIQPAGELQTPTYQPPPIYSPAQQSPTGFSAISIPSEPSGEAASRTGGINVLSVQNIQNTLSPNEQYSPSIQVYYTPLPEGQSRPVSDQLNLKSDSPLHTTVYELDSQPVRTIQKGDNSPVPELTMEEEITIVKATILQMEIEKREGQIKNILSKDDQSQAQSMSQTSPRQSEISQVQFGPSEPSIHVTPALASFVEHQNFPRPPASPASPSFGVTSSITPSLQQPPSKRTPTNPYYPVPPPPPPQPQSAHIRQYQYPPPPLVAASGNIEQQIYAIPPMPPRPQQQPQIQRQDSGYYSNPPSRNSSTFSTATLSTCSSPQQMLSPQSTGSSLLSPQPTGQILHNVRHSALYGSISSNQVSSMSPQPAPYFPPPPGSAARPVSQGKGYFSQNIAPPSPPIPIYQPGMGQSVQVQNYSARPSFQGSQSWQWGTAPMKSNREPDYGVPPAIPAPWKSS